MPTDVEDMIIARLDRIEDKMDDLSRKGCARADDHARFADRLQALEASASESRGKWAVIGAFLGILSAPIVAWGWRRITNGQ